MSKLKQVKKKVIAAGIFASIVTIVCIGLAISFFLYTSSLESNKNTIQRQNRKLESELKMLSKQHKKAQASLQLYEKLTEGGQGSTQALDRKRAASILNKLHDDFILSELNLSIAPIEERKGRNFKRKTGAIISSRVNISFKSITDEFAYAFLDELIRQFPGYINLTHFSLNLMRQVTLRNGKSEIDKPPSFVEAHVEYDWLGLQMNEDKKKNEQ